MNVNSSTGGNPGSSIDLAFNFGTQATNTPLGFIEDIGNPFGLQGSLNYGWVNKNTNAPIDVTNMARNRPPAIDADPIRETLIHMNRLQSLPDANWEIEIPNGTYRVVLQEGDPNNEGRAGTRHLIKVEGTTLIDFEPGTGFGTRTGVAEVIITDGKLTIDGSDGINAKLCAVSIQSTDVLQFPAIVGAIPLDGATNVDLNTSISANFLSFPNVSASGATSLDNTTITDSTVQLFSLTGGSFNPVAVTINGTGGGDAINISTNGPLEANTRYRYIINGVRDLAGAEIFPYSAESVTGATSMYLNMGVLELSYY